MSALKAYQVHDGDEGWAIVFAYKNVVARREGANEIDADFSSVSCKRKPEWDQYAPGPVPPLARIASGWWYECAHCGRRVSEDLHAEVEDEGLDPNDFEIVEAGRLVYCSHTCSQKEWAQKRCNTAAKVALMELFASTLPDATILSVHVYGQRLEPRNKTGDQSTVVYKFPGGKNNVHWTFGDEEHQITIEDVYAFYAWRGKPVPEDLRKRVDEIRQRFGLPEGP